MAKRVTPQDIVTFHDLYAKYGTYARVARETGFSGNTVSHYLNPKGTSRTVKHTWNELLNGAHA